MPIIKTILIEFLSWTGWLGTVSFFDFLKCAWIDGSKRDFFKILFAGISGVIFSATLLTIFFLASGSVSIWLIVITTLWAGNIFWIVGTLGTMIVIDKAVDFIDYYYDWKNSINGPSN